MKKAIRPMVRRSSDDPIIINLRPFTVRPLTIREGPSTAATDAEANSSSVMLKQIYCELPPPSKYSALAELAEWFGELPMESRTLEDLRADVTFRLDGVTEAVKVLIDRCRIATSRSTEPAAPVGSAAAILRQAAMVLDMLHHDATVCQKTVEAA